MKGKMHSSEEIIRVLRHTARGGRRWSWPMRFVRWRG